MSTSTAPRHEKPAATLDTGNPAALLGLKPTTLSWKVHRMGLKKLVG